jgi:hypothetical protein
MDGSPPVVEEILTTLLLKMAYIYIHIHIHIVDLPIQSCDSPSVAAAPNDSDSVTPGQEEDQQEHLGAAFEV